MSKPTISILSRRRLRLTYTRRSRGISVARVADAMRSRLLEMGRLSSPAVVTTEFYHAATPRAGCGYNPCVKIALAQVNPTIGDFDGNRRLVLDATAEAGRRGAELVVFPELTLSGYPPKDLLERPAFIDAAASSLDMLTTAVASSATAILVGYPERRAETTGRAISNSAALIDGGRVIGIARKSLLPTYDVFD